MESHQTYTMVSWLNNNCDYALPLVNKASLSYMLYSVAMVTLGQASTLGPVRDRPTQK